MAIIEFDVPGADNTVPLIINLHGVITGRCDTHGFIRYADGTIITFAVPDVSITQPSWINDNGVIVGYFDTIG